MSDDPKTAIPGRGFASRAVHAGEHQPVPDCAAATTPIYASSSFSYDETATLDQVFGAERPGYVYSRHGHPTVRALELAIAALEETEDALAVASGMAALHLAILNEVRSDSRIVAANDLYGATTALLDTLFGTLGIRTTYVDALDLTAVGAALESAKPKVLLVETMSNPLLRVPDIAALSRIARLNGTALVVDNTFATPYLVNPAKLGADVVVHSTTKYLGGHGDVTGGVIAGRSGRIADITELNKLSGAVLGPFEAWLTLRGVKTLPLRMRRQSESADILANWLRDHPRVERVHYPSFADRCAAGAAAPGSAMFNNGLRGGMVSFALKGAGRDEIFRFLQSLRLCRSATTLGDVYTLVLYPAMSTHRGLSPEQRAAVGIGDGLVRMSVGIEDVEDIQADLDAALADSTPA
ncbi:MAG: trans-sulfuration enzyme family protein [Thermomicrobiales bacterium]